MAELPDNCRDDELLILRGHNRWIVARTDRDAVDQEDAQRTTGAFLSRILGPASPPGTRGIFEQLLVAGRTARFVIGAARPVLVTATQPESAEELNQIISVSPDERVIALEPSCPVRRSVRAQVPWIVDVEFDWRAPDTRIAWPRRSVSDAGLGDNEANTGLDFLVVAAYFAGAAQESDTDVLQEVSADTRKAIRRAVGSSSPVLVGTLLGGIMGAGLIGYAWWRWGR